VPDTFPIYEVLKKYEGQRLKVYLSGVAGSLDGFIEEDLTGGYSKFRQPAMTVPHPMTGEPVEIPESTVVVYRPAIVLFEPSETTALSQLTPVTLVQ